MCGSHLYLADNDTAFEVETRLSMITYLFLVRKTISADIFQDDSQTATMFFVISARALVLAR